MNELSCFQYESNKQLLPLCTVHSVQCTNDSLDVLIEKRKKGKKKMMKMMKMIVEMMIKMMMKMIIKMKKKAESNILGWFRLNLIIIRTRTPTTTQDVYKTSSEP